MNRFILGGPRMWTKNVKKGYIDQKVNRAFASECRVGSSLLHVAPYYHNHRQQGTERQLNPQPYTAEYHGHKLHIDQNEKLAAYGVVHDCAIDSYSRYIPALVCMPVKNSVIIIKIFLKNNSEQHFSNRSCQLALFSPTAFV